MSIKPYFRSETFETTRDDEIDKPDGPETPPPTLELTLEPTKPAELIIPPPAKRGRGRPRKNPMAESHLTSIDAPIKEPPPMDILVLIQEALFMDSRRKEINRLLEKGVFATVIVKDVPQGVRIFNLYFINKIKHPSTNKAFKKSRLVI
jgi:hypothetical protein